MAMMQETELLRGRSGLNLYSHRASGVAVTCDVRTSVAAKKILKTIRMKNND